MVAAAECLVFLLAEVTVGGEPYKVFTPFWRNAQVRLHEQLAGARRDVHLKAGESFRITPHTIHQMEAVTDCDVLEASTPELDDVVRLSDRYGREGTSAP